MSVHATSWIIRHSPTTGTDRLLLIVLADYADEEWEAYPSMETLRHDARLKRVNTVHEVITRLVRDGHLAREVNAAPDRRFRGDRRPNLYRILTDPGEPCRRPKCGWCGSTPNGDPQGERVHAEPSNGSTPNGYLTTIEPPLTVETPSVSPPAAPHIVALCDDLADSIAAHREGPKPKVTKRWLRDMRLLVERGPLHVEDPKPVEPHRVATAIRFVFTELAEPTGRDGFCWADQIRSAHALRDHWEQLADAARRLVRQRKRDPLAPAVSTSADPLAGPPLRLGAP